VEVEVRAFGTRTCPFVCATPVDAGKLEMPVAMRLREAANPASLNPALLLAPRCMVNSRIARLTFKGFVRGLMQDFL